MHLVLLLAVPWNKSCITQIQQVREFVTEKPEANSGGRVCCSNSYSSSLIFFASLTDSSFSFSELEHSEHLRERRAREAVKAAARFSATTAWRRPVMLEVCLAIGIVVECSSHSDCYHPQIPHPYKPKESEEVTTQIQRERHVPRM